MNRKIQFRHYDETLNKMIYLPEGILNKQKNIMQCTFLNTGLINEGDTLYEGDIIRVAHGSASGKVGVIVFNEAYGGFIVEGDYCKHQHHVTLTEDVAYKAEILGNIYENPDYPLTGGCWI